MFTISFEKVINFFSDISLKFLDWCCYFVLHSAENTKLPFQFHYFPCYAPSLDFVFKNIISNKLTTAILSFLSSPKSYYSYASLKMFLIRCRSDFFLSLIKQICLRVQACDSIPYITLVRFQRIGLPSPLLHVTLWTSLGVPHCGESLHH